jgi:hypothetical protein
VKGSLFVLRGLKIFSPKVFCVAEEASSPEQQQGVLVEMSWGAPLEGRL